MEYRRYEILADKLKALAHPARICIVKGLSESEKGVSEMCACMKAPQPTISLHLSRLKSAGIVHSERRGNSVVYRVKDEKLAALVSALLEQ